MSILHITLDEQASVDSNRFIQTFDSRSASCSSIEQSHEAQASQQPHSLIRNSTMSANQPGASDTRSTKPVSFVLYPVHDTQATARPCIVVLPGGGYHHLAEHEGAPIARWLNGLGIHAAVLHYHTQSDYTEQAESDVKETERNAVQAPTMETASDADSVSPTKTQAHLIESIEPNLLIEQVEAALQAVQQQRPEIGWKVLSDQIGLIGFSAGGHLAAMTATLGTIRPHLLMLAYPVITMSEPYTHQGSRQHLLGDSYRAEHICQYSPDCQVDERTPPTFIWSSADDASVPVQNSLSMAGALTAAGIEHELHVFEQGRHGLGLAEGHPHCGAWTDLAASWLQRHGYVDETILAASASNKYTNAQVHIPATSETLFPAIHIAGDSTAAIKGATEKPMSGWGEYLAGYMQPDIIIHNHAINGRSTRSFIAEGRLQYIADQLQAGDYLFIQFGHNDSKIEDPTRYADPEQDYPDFLQQYIDTARGKGAFPVLLTSVSRRLYLENGQLDPQALGAYPEAMRAVASKTGTPLVDLFQCSQQLYRELGEKESACLFMHLRAGAHPNYPDGISDNTHFSEQGAQRIARLAADAIRQHAQLQELAKLLLPERDPSTANSY